MIASTKGPRRIEGERVQEQVRLLRQEVEEQGVPRGVQEVRQAVGNEGERMLREGAQHRRRRGRVQQDRDRGGLRGQHRSRHRQQN